MIGYKLKDPQILKWVNIANNSTNLLLYLVNDTLDFFQIKSGKFNIRVEKFKLKE